MKERLGYIDIAKGIGIILVILSHTDYPELMYYTSPFFVPIFFFCSGYTSSRKDTSLNTCIKRQVTKLLKPYIFFSLFLLIYFHNFSLRAIVGIFYSRYSLYPFGTEPDIFRLMIVGNYPMWFLTCMAITYVLYDLLIYYPKHHFYLAAIYIVITFCATFFPILLPWSIDTAPLMAVIMFCGTLLKRYVPEIYNNKKPHTLTILSVILYFLMLPFCHDINISVRMFGPSMFIYLITTITGCILLTYLSRLIQGTFIGKILKQIGIHSLSIFCIEIPFIIIGKDMAILSLKQYPQMLLPEVIAFIQLIIALIGGLVISIIIQSNKYTKKIVS